MSVEATAPTWFPEGTINAVNVTDLALILVHTAKQLGFTRETYAAAIAQQAEALCGLPAEMDIDPDVQRFVSERLMAAGIALAGGSN